MLKYGIRQLFFPKRPACIAGKQTCFRVLKPRLRWGVPSHVGRVRVLVTSHEGRIRVRITSHLKNLTKRENIIHMSRFRVKLKKYSTLFPIIKNYFQNQHYLIYFSYIN